VRAAHVASAFFSVEQRGPVLNPFYHLRSAHYVFFHVFVFLLEQGYLQPNRPPHLGGPTAQEAPFQMLKGYMRPRCSLPTSMPEMVLRIAGNPRAPGLEEKRGWLMFRFDEWLRTGSIGEVEFLQLWTATLEGEATTDQDPDGEWSRTRLARKGILDNVVPQMGELTVKACLDSILGGILHFKAVVMGAGMANQYFVLGECMRDAFRHLNIPGEPVTAGLSASNRTSIVQALRKGSWWFGMPSTLSAPWTPLEMENLRYALCWWGSKVVEHKLKPDTSEFVINKQTGNLQPRRLSLAPAVVTPPSDAADASSSRPATTYTAPRTGPGDDNPDSKRMRGASL
jgi:hypothetical protein